MWFGGELSALDGQLITKSVNREIHTKRLQKAILLVHAQMANLQLLNLWRDF